MLKNVSKIVAKSVIPSNGKTVMLSHIVFVGFEHLTRVNCNSIFAGVHSYDVSDIQNSQTYCGTGSESWDVSTDPQEMSFDYNVCPQLVAHAGKTCLEHVFILFS